MGWGDDDTAYGMGGGGAVVKASSLAPLLEINPPNVWSNLISSILQLGLHIYLQIAKVGVGSWLIKWSRKMLSQQVVTKLVHE